ncbi:MAG: preprotein translocase subunit SecG [Planctomycetaceae bacterium]|nr:preprotein translocase subunit SecG [Planctomycetaceae bacterium]
MQVLLIVLLFTVSLFMILLIMIQRGKGGGLAGAFGGMGGQSAFGTKAGDTFTKITIWTVLFWFSLCVTTLMILNGKGCSTGGLNVDSGSGRTSAPAAPPSTQTE